jgi:hypothetical protein
MCFTRLNHIAALTLFSIGLCVTGSGCGSGKLETGYAYTPLGDSPNKRRSYYADPFTPEARAAQQERQADFDARRPVPGN